MLVLVH